MRVKNLGSLLNELKPLLGQYLEDYGTKFIKDKFQCPNRADHSNEDENVSCNFYPDEEHFKCFSCLETGDIFNACHLLEGRPISGPGFITDNVLYLAKKYNIAFELTEETEQDKKQAVLQKFLKYLTKYCNDYLVKSLKKYKKSKKTNKDIQKVFKLLKKRKWLSAVKNHSLGFVPSDKKLKAFIDKFQKKYDLLKPESLDLSYEGIEKRLIYPLYNAYGMIIGVSTRRIDEGTQPKYKHYPIKLGKKSINVLYNLNKARKSAKIYLVEGASSVFTLSSKGVNNVVAVLGSNFVEKHYQWLVKNSIKELVFCFDGDAAGRKALEKAIQKVQNKSDIQIKLKLLPKDKDPADIVQEQSVQKFLEIEEKSLYDYQLDNYVNTGQKEYRDSLFEIILAEEDALQREKMIEKAVKKTKLLKTTLLEEIKKYEKKNDLIEGISMAEYMEEGSLLEREVDQFDKFRWKTGELIGLKTGWQFFDEAMDGLQIGLHMVGGKWNVGKSAFITNLALRLLKDPNNCILYFSIDDPSVFKTIPRMISILSQVPVNTVLKPHYGIEKNETLQENEKAEMTYNIEESIGELKSYAKRFSLKDAKHGQDLNFIKRKIKLCKQRALDLGNKNLIVFVDFLHMIKTKNREENAKLIAVAEQLKSLSTIYETPIITTVMGTKAGMETKDVKDTAIKGAVELQYEADSITLLETDFYDSNSRLYFYDDEGQSRPIISANIAKNKVSGFRGKLFYKFFGETLTYKECGEEGQQKFRKKTR